MKRFTLMMLAAAALAACSTNPITGGPRPPQGAGPGGTNFGFWERDAEGSVDQFFRTFISRTWSAGQEAAAQKVLEQDGFSCRDGNRPDGRPVPSLDCERVYSVSDDVHTWQVEFWGNERAPQGHYSRIHLRDPLRNYNDKRNNRG